MSIEFGFFIKQTTYHPFFSSPKPTDLFAKASVDHIASLRGSKKTTAEREVYARLESARAAVYSFGDALKHLVMGLGKVVYAIAEAPMSLAYKNIKPMATLTTAGEHLTSSGKMVPLFVGALVGIVAPDATTSLYGKLSLPQTIGRFTRVCDAVKGFFGSRLGKAACLVVVGAAGAVAYQRFNGETKLVQQPINPLRQNPLVGPSDDLNRFCRGYEQRMLPRPDTSTLSDQPGTCPAPVVQQQEPRSSAADVSNRPTKKLIPRIKESTALMQRIN